MSTLKMFRHEFRRLVEPVMPFVAPESAVHTLAGVRIRTEPGRAIAEAVSARMLGMCVREHEGVTAGFDMVFPFDDLAVVMRGPWVPSDVIGLELTTVGTVIVETTYDGMTSLSEYDVLDEKHFPDLSKKIVKALQIEQRTTSVWLDPDQLNAFRVAAVRANNPDMAPMVFHPGATSHDMVLVTCGDHFTGLASAATATPQLPAYVKRRVSGPPAGNPIELWTKRLSTPEGE